VALLTRIGDDGASDAAWRLLPRTRLAAGDSVGTEQAFRNIASTTSGPRQAEAMVEVGVLTLARRDSAAASKLFEAALDSAPRSSAARAAAGLVAIGGTDLELTVRLASTLDQAGDGASALEAYDRAARLAARGEGPVPEWARLARARLMATVRSRQDEAIDEFRAIRGETQDERVGARNLETWAGVRRRQGRDAEVATLRRWLLAEHPGSPEATEVRWDSATTAQSDGDLERALSGYARLAEEAPTLGRAGEARMRMGQIHLGRGDMEQAAAVFEAYLEDFPTGRRWDEAAYWAARVRLQLGDSGGARAWVARVRRDEPISYYAVMGARLLGDPYDVDMPPGDAPTVAVGWLDEGLARLDLLTEAGLEQGADAEVRRLRERAEGTPSTQLLLAEALNDRGRTIEGINIGWALRADGHPWDRRLLRVVYPFPYRELVVREAAEWGVDPIMLAALIRQESAFKADIRSRAGAVGLMQVMPPTGRQLARAHGPEDFHEDNLTTPEVNLHLGAAFFVEMNRRYGGDLPIVLSAYNAGPTRATRWRRYPEASDPERFTERIPFEETRGYVKNIRRNLGVYQALYGPE
jgi:soluble lytic murein transglycosylase